MSDNLPDFSDFSGDETSRPPYDMPTPEEIENTLKAYALFLYWRNERGHRISLQRSILISTKDEEPIEARVSSLVDKINELTLEIDDLDREHNYALARIPTEDETFAKTYDSVIYAIKSELSLGRRSVETGDVFEDVTAKYCPHSQSRLRFYILAN